MFSSSFAELGHLGRGDLDDLVADQRVELHGAAAALLGEPADHLRRGADRVVGAPGVDPLRREGEVEVAAGGQAGLLEDREQPLAGGARVGGRLQHHELPLAQDPRELRWPRRPGRRGRARGGWRAGSARRSPPPRTRRGPGRSSVAVKRSAIVAEPLRGHVLDVRLAAPQPLDPRESVSTPDRRRTRPRRTRPPGAARRSRGRRSLPSCARSVGIAGPVHDRCRLRRKRGVGELRDQAHVRAGGIAGGALHPAHGRARASSRPEWPPGRRSSPTPPAPRRGRLARAAPRARGARARSRRSPPPDRGWRGLRPALHRQIAAPRAPPPASRSRAFSDEQDPHAPSLTDFDGVGFERPAMRVDRFRCR